VRRPGAFPGRVATALLALGVVLTVNAAHAAVFEPRDFDSPSHEARYKAMTAELRCLVCQNQNIADSNAPLAQDLRREVYDMLHDGSSDAEIVDFMVTRYGDFVLYRPPVNALTVALWAGPAVLVVLGLVVLMRTQRRQREEAAGAAGPLSREERDRLAALTERGGD